MTRSALPGLAIATAVLVLGLLLNALLPIRLPWV